MLAELFEIIQERKRRPPPDSYTASLFEKGQDEILRKVGEEALEVILAAKSQTSARLIEEVADLLYHTLVLLAFEDLSLAQVEAELRRRHQVSGRSEP